MAGIGARMAGDVHAALVVRKEAVTHDCPNEAQALLRATRAAIDSHVR